MPNRNEAILATVSGSGRGRCSFSRKFLRVQLRPLVRGWFPLYADMAGNVACFRGPVEHCVCHLSDQRLLPDKAECETQWVSASHSATS